MKKVKKTNSVKVKNNSIYNRNYIKNDKELEIFTIDNFLREEECDYLNVIIQKNSSRSTVATTESNGEGIVHEGRTSYTATLPNEDPIVSIINDRISKEIGIEEKYGESVQGQVYDIGQEFKHHTDYFSEDTYPNNCLYSGQRTWTVMVYLNDVEEGGMTDFPHIGLIVTPKKGMAVAWKNSDGTGKEYTASMHAGLPVVKGKKIIITKWYREREWNMVEDMRLAKEFFSKKNNTNSEKIKSKEIIPFTQETFSLNQKYKRFNHSYNKAGFKLFKNADELPRLTENGFKVTKVPTKTWFLIQEMYQLLQHTKTKEIWPNIEKYIHDTKGVAQVEIFNTDYCIRLKEIIQEELRPVHEEFINFKEKIEPVWIYGIRSYLNDSILEKHTDTLQTHHISSIIVVDKKVNKDWPLQIQSHDGKWHNVYADVGDIILYESATCQHGRVEPLDGEYFRNFFVHYKLSNYIFTP